MTALAPCWTAESAQAILHTEALSSAREVFLAVHTPVEGFTVHGIQSSDLSEESEGELLRVLSCPDRQHAFCVVRGEPGSGKSHLIMWLGVKWEVESDLVLLIRRADGSLEGALEQLEHKLGAEFKELFSQLGKRSKASAEGRALSFLTMLGPMLRATYFDPPFPDSDWCARFDPEDLFSRPSIRDRWKAPERILKLIEGRGVGENGARNSQTADFDLYDIADLVKAGEGNVINSGVRPGTEKLWNALKEEAANIEDYRRENWPSDELWQRKPDLFRQSRTLVNALNLRRNEAIRYSLQVSSDDLKKLFRDVRVALNTQKRRLVLLLEDITSFEGVDDSLIDVLVDDAQTQSGDAPQRLCPLISVVGVTPLYYQKLQANYKQRITHEVALGEDGGAFQDVAILRSSEVRGAFVSRYLSAVRAGHERLKEWSANGEKHGAPPPNICPKCPKQTTCFATFGAIDGRGLFPFNDTAIQRLYDALNPNDRAQTWRTPRGIIKGILSPVLRNPAHLELGNFPHAALESSSLSEDLQSGQVISFDLDRTIRNRIPDETQQARMRRLVSYWGQPNRIATTELDGELAFAGIKRSIFTAFGLPWIGDDQPDANSDHAVETTPEAPSIVLQVEPVAPAPAPVAPMPGQGGRPARAPAERPSVGAPPSRQKASRSDLDKLRADLSKWKSGAPPEHGSKWNEFLSEVLQSADLRRFGISPELRAQALTANRIKLEGSTGGDKDRFLVPRKEWVVDGLDAFLALRLDKAGDSTKREYQSRLARLARFSASLEEKAAQYINDHIPKLEDGSIWSPAGTLMQVLLAREILRGTVPADASVADCLTIVLGPDLETQSSPKARTKHWLDYLNATDKTHDQMRNQLRSLVNLEGDPTKPLVISGVVDLSQIIAAAERMLKKLSFDSVPKEEFKAVVEAERARSICIEQGRNLPSAPRLELQTMAARAGDVLDAMEGLSINAYLDGVTSSAETVSEHMPHASPEKIAAWRDLQAGQSRSQEEVDKVQELLITLTQDAESLPKSNTELTQWLVREPAEGLARIWTLIKAAKDLVKELTEHAARRIEEAQSIPSSEIVTTAAQTLSEVDAFWKSRDKGGENE
jgi:hypothetical protein